MEVINEIGSLIALNKYNTSQQREKVSTASGNNLASINRPPSE